MRHRRVGNIEKRGNRVGRDGLKSSTEPRRKPICLLLFNLHRQIDTAVDGRTIIERCKIYYNTLE